MSGEGFQQGTPALFHEDILHGAPKSSALANNVSVVSNFFSDRVLARLAIAVSAV